MSRSLINWVFGIAVVAAVVVTSIVIPQAYPELDWLKLNILVPIVFVVSWVAAILFLNHRIAKRERKYKYLRFGEFPIEGEFPVLNELAISDDIFVPESVASELDGPESDEVATDSFVWVPRDRKSGVSPHTFIGDIAPVRPASSTGPKIKAEKLTINRELKKSGSPHLFLPPAGSPHRIH